MSSLDDHTAGLMKFREDRPLADVDTAVRKLLEIANGIEADHAGRLQIGTINSQFVSAGGTYDDYSAAVKMAIERGYVTRHPSGGYVTFTQPPTRRPLRAMSGRVGEVASCTETCQF